jgi:hypothetical protein
MLNISSIHVDESEQETSVRLFSCTSLYLARMRLFKFRSDSSSRAWCLEYWI